MITYLIIAFIAIVVGAIAGFALCLWLGSIPDEPMHRKDVEKHPFYEKYDD